jgi:hypothetical protein
MSVMEFDLAHRYSPHNTLSFPDYYYYDDHDTPLALSFGVGARTNPRGYRIGESMVDSRGSFSVARDEPSYDHGNSRRRIAVAVSVRAWAICVWFFERYRNTNFNFPTTSCMTSTTDLKHSALDAVSGRSSAAAILAMGLVVTAADKPE